MININQNDYEKLSLDKMRKDFSSFYAVTDDKYKKDEFDKSVDKSNQIITKKNSNENYVTILDINKSEYLVSFDLLNKNINQDWLLIPTFKGSQKAAFAHKKAVLIDDREKNIDCWVEAGGIGILHTKADDTIAKLNEIIES